MQSVITRHHRHHRRLLSIFPSAHAIQQNIDVDVTERQSLFTLNPIPASAKGYNGAQRMHGNEEEEACKNGRRTGNVALADRRTLGPTDRHAPATVTRVVNE